MQECYIYTTSRAMIPDDKELIKDLPRYMNNIKLKAAGVEMPLSLEQLVEMKKCMYDPVYFIETYCWIISKDKGFCRMELFEYQKDMIKHLHTKGRTLFLMPRQSAKTTTNAAYALHYMLFNPYKTIAVLAHKASGARELLDRLKKMYEELPLWLQQGVLTWNKTSIELGNGSKMLAAATTSTAIRGLSINCVVGNTMVTYVNDCDQVFHTTITKAHSARFNKCTESNGDGCMKRYYTVYKTKNNVNGKEYIGFHSTNDIDDGYLGPGKLIKEAIAKYGPESFSKEIIEVFDNQEEAEALERLVVNEEYNNGTETKMFNSGDSIPEGWTKGRAKNANSNK